MPENLSALDTDIGRCGYLTADDAYGDIWEKASKGSFFDYMKVAFFSKIREIS